MTTLLCWHAAQIALGINGRPEGWSSVSDAISTLMSDGGWLEKRERIFVWAHVLTVLGFLVYLPYSKHLHRDRRAQCLVREDEGARLRLEPLDFEVEDEAALRLGSGTLVDMTWKQMLDTRSPAPSAAVAKTCARPGRRARALTRLLVMGLRDRLFAEGPAVLAGGEATALVPGAVTDAGRVGLRDLRRLRARMPVSIEHVDRIVDLRRHLVMVGRGSRPRPGRCST